MLTCQHPPAYRAELSPHPPPAPASIPSLTLQIQSSAGNFLSLGTSCSSSLFAQLCLTLCDPMDCSLPGSSVHGISQARTLEWVAISFSRGSSHPGNKTTPLASPELAGGFFTTPPPVKPLIMLVSSVQFSHSLMSDSLRPHEPQHARPPCPSSTPRVHPNPCPSS